MFFWIRGQLVSRARTQNGHFRGHNCEAGRADLIFGRAVVGAVVLVEQVRVCAERHRRGVPRLARDLDDGGALGDQEADVAVALQVVCMTVIKLVAGPLLAATLTR
jgi:hypothetical protein